MSSTHCHIYTTFFAHYFSNCSLMGCKISHSFTKRPYFVHPWHTYTHTLFLKLPVEICHTQWFLPCVPKMCIFESFFSTNYLHIIYILTICQFWVMWIHLNITWTEIFIFAKINWLNKTNPFCQGHCWDRVNLLNIFQPQISAISS